MLHPKQECAAKWWTKDFTTLQRLKHLVATIPLVVVTLSSSVLGEETAPFPGFRHVDVANLEKPVTNTATVIVLADEDFAPWSFKGADGALQGISVDLAIAACAEAKLTCEIKAKPFSELLQELRSGAGHLIVTGIKPDPVLLRDLQLTRPYFRSLGRFAVRVGSPLAAADVRTLAGKRLGFVKNSAHARFLETYYERSALTSFDSTTAMFDALRTGQVDAAFGDAVQMSFWLAGQSSRDCCTYLGKAFVHRATFSRSLVFVGGQNQAPLIRTMDAALDQLEVNKTTATIFRALFAHTHLVRQFFCSRAAKLIKSTSGFSRNAETQ